MAMDREPFAKVYGNPGGRSRLTGLFRSAWPLLVVLPAAGYLFRAALPEPAMTPATAGMLFLVLAAAFALLAHQGLARIGNYIKGARGEEEVARALARLPAGYTVFHGVSVPELSGGAGDVDHLVVGPGGVFLIETKNWSRPVTVTGSTLLYGGREPDRPPLEQVRGHSAAVAARLAAGGERVTVRPVICFTAQVPAPDPQAAGDVVLCGLRSLLEVVQPGGAAVLSEERRAAVVRIIRELMC